MTEREALKLTLEALKQIDEAMPFPVAKLAIMEAEKALAKPEQEPVACVGPWHDGRLTLIPRYSHQTFEREQPLYTTPPQRTWVGLTDEERNDCLVSADPCEALAEPEARQLMEDIEAKLKQKNGYAEEKNT